ncbi:MAG: ankyrin repeat domain-containing protein [Bacteroidetes bacterium]|nr:ankyrin repeat domain-containing protein [Bacteroidota bacterium]
MKLLISRSKYLNKLNKNSDTIIHQLCYTYSFHEIDKRLKLIKYLHSKGADLKIKNKNKKTPLKIAKERYLTPIKNYLSKETSIFKSIKNLF